MSKIGARQDPWQANAADQRHQVLPDVASTSAPQVGGRLDRVGMSRVDVVIRRHDENGRVVLTPAKADAFVSLDAPDAKGIHMSRLFLRLHEALDSEELSPKLLERLLHGFVQSHAKLSRSSGVRLTYDHLCRRAALLSDHSAWRHYPVQIESSLENNAVRHKLSVRVTYSSTCPCSAALAKQLLREQFEEEFSAETLVDPRRVSRWIDSDRMMYPTPHSQRSHADVTVVLGDVEVAFPTNDLIETVESAVATAVQTVVKRRDEQHFARINGENLMFCEDSARRIREVIDKVEYVRDYRVRVEHLESLHAHDAVAVVTKGVPGGLTADD